jgi:hypothetical protein
METMAKRLPGRRWVLLALVALLGLTIVAGTASVGASASSHAVVAKKKCKKKHKHSARFAKKCKNVHHIVLPAPGPLVRATLSWSANDEVDLHAFDAGGNHAGWDFGVGSVVNNIPSAHHNGDVGAGGPSESFTDDIFVAGGPSNREFSFVACLYDDNPGDYSATFKGVSKDGTPTTLALEGTPSDGPDVYVLSVPGGPAVSNPAAVCDL